MKFLNYIFGKIKQLFVKEDAGQEDVVSQAPKKKPKKSKPKKKTLACGSMKDLKKSLDNIYREIARPDHYKGVSGLSAGFLNKHNVKLLRQLGPYMMPNNDLLGEKKLNRIFPVGRKIPTIAFVGFPDKLDNVIKSFDGKKERVLTGRFIFAIEMNKRDFYGKLEIMRRSERLFVVGAALYDDDPPKFARKAKGKMIWDAWYAAIDSNTGKSRVLKSWRCMNTGKHSRKILYGPEYSKIDNLYRDSLLAEILNIWINRDFHWQIAAKRGSHLITFCIDDNEAKEYFKDREIEDNGKRKRIFHWVRSHYRDIGTKTVTVKTHTRGNKVFTWGPYHIAIRIPGRESYLLSQLDIEPVAEADEKKFKTISMKKAIKSMQEREVMP